VFERVGMQMKVFDRRAVPVVVKVVVVGMQIGCGRVLAQIGQTISGKWKIFEINY
jgi:hypothetical protein